MPITAMTGGGGVEGDEYIDRGDPAAFDFTQANLTLDTTWRDLNLSAIINDSTAHTVCLRVMMIDNLTAQWIQFRKNGNTNGYNASTLRTQAANVYMDGDLWVFCDTGQVIEYMGNAGTDGVNICVKGWLRPAV